MKLTIEQLQFLVACINSGPIRGTDEAKLKGELLIGYSDELEKATAEAKQDEEPHG